MAAPAAHPFLIVVPNSAASVEGNTGSLVPFSSNNERYQQVYAASEFGAIPAGGAFITAIAFRVYPDGTSYSATYPTLQVNLSTTSKAPDGLSTTFANNVGADDTIVFTGSVPFSTSGIGIPAPFELVVDFTTPFWYDPAAGNLLVDIRNSGGGPDTSFDAVYATGDSVSYIDGGLTSTSGTASTVGLVTRFTVPAFTTNADLSSLTLDGGTLIPSFSPGITNYRAIVTDATGRLIITATAADSGTIQVRVNGGFYAPVPSGFPTQPPGFFYGDNRIDVKVTSLYGSNVKTYTITATDTNYIGSADFYISLTGSQVNPPNPVWCVGGGIAAYDGATGQISVNIFFTGLTAPANSSHIHLGPPGINGPPLVSFVSVTPAATFGSISGGPFAFPSVNVPNLMAGNIYFDIHDSVFPGGEIRGQLVPTWQRPVPGDLNGDGIVSQSELNAVLTNYWANSPWLYMTNTAGLGTSTVQFALTNAAGWNFSVLVSTNLADWTELPAPAYPLYQFNDREATNQPTRYYRLRYP